MRIDDNSGIFILDLNVSKNNVHIFTVESTNNNGGYLSWGVEFISNEKIHAESRGRNELVISAALDDVLKEEYLVLRNYKNERLKVLIKPNLETLRPKDYKFKITNKSVNGRDVIINIFSFENGKEIPWVCSYSGEPLSYKITPFKSDKSGKVIISLQGKIYGKFETIIEFTQNDSKKIIRLKLLQSNESVEIIEAD